MLLVNLEKYWVITSTLKKQPELMKIYRNEVPLMAGSESVYIQYNYPYMRIANDKDQYNFCVCERAFFYWTLGQPNFVVRILPKTMLLVGQCNKNIRGEMYGELQRTAPPKALPNTKKWKFESDQQKGEYLQLKTHRQFLRISTTLFLKKIKNELK